MTDAKHSSSTFRPDGSIVYLGEPAGFVVRFSDGFTLYIAGDTCLFGDMGLIKTIHQPDAAILPIGDFYTMGPRDAAHACAFLGVKTVIPCHYGTFPALTGTPGELRAQLDSLELDTRIIELEPGVETNIK